ncbi:unnamed protein product [Didymodactylos carnosus]|uniref:HAT C-terminal dimerisation domain-containing protein n=1 Tax=Didymodactylos carnosus TaxID=1234261 RepID=A0A815X7I4_9BILA|nr:unnamed protein product [Didymodactylos carnosus]CAF4414670.1 unnamed protein product [Didymodactylos carnosus]
MNLIHNLNQRLTNQFFGMNARQVLKQIEAIDEQKVIVLIQSFNLVIKTVIDYTESYYAKDKAYYETLSCFYLQSNGFLTWKDLFVVVDLISIPDLNIDKLYNEYCDLKVFDEHIIQTDGKLKEQVNTFTAKQHEHITSSASPMMSETENDTSDDENMTHKSRQTSDTHIRSDELWAYLLNVNGNTTPNMTKIVSYLFSIPCSNAFVESIFSKMKHSWTDYRNKMDVQLMAAELKLRTNCEYTCSYFHDYVLSQPVLLRKIRTNEKYERKKQRICEN